LNQLFGEPDAKEDDFDTDEALAKIDTPISQTGDIWLPSKLPDWLTAASMPA